MLRTGVVLAVGVVLALPAVAAASVVSYDGNAMPRTITFAGTGAADGVVVADGQDDGQNSAFKFSAPGLTNGSGCELTLLGEVVCPFDGERFVFDLGGGNDSVTINDPFVGATFRPSIINGGAGDDTVRGGGAADTLNGDAGRDIFVGLEGNDVINARDGAPDASIDCGGGPSDIANVDTNDPTTNGCEIVNRPIRDDDHDGSAHGVDCNDSNTRIHPGATEIPNNGIDEDCSNGDLHADRDGDGTLPPTDCDDANKTIHPGARDKPQNGIDENCDREDADWRVNRTSIGTGWLAFTAYTQVTRLTFSAIPRRGKVKIRCLGKHNGCPFASRKLKVKKRKATATKLFKHAQLRTGTELEVRITAPDTIGKVVRFTMRSHALPKAKNLCLPPGKKKPGKCS